MNMLRLEAAAASSRHNSSFSTRGGMTRKRGVASSVRSILTLHNHELILLSNLHVKEEMISYNGFFKIDSFQKIQDSFRVYFLVMDPTLGATGQRKGKGGKNHLGCFLPSPKGVIVIQLHYVIRLVWKKTHSDSSA